MASSNREPADEGPAEQLSHALPDNLAQPARRALANAGYARLEQLATISEAEIARLHGIRPHTLHRLRQALAAHGLSFAAEQHKDG